MAGELSANAAAIPYEPLTQLVWGAAKFVSPDLSGLSIAAPDRCCPLFGVPEKEKRASESIAIAAIHRFFVRMAQVGSWTQQ